MRNESLVAVAISFWDINLICGNQKYGKIRMMESNWKFMEEREKCIFKL